MGKDGAGVGWEQRGSRHHGGFSVADEPIQPIDPAAWVSHSAALTGTFPAYPGSSSMSTMTSGSSLPEGEPPALFNPCPLPWKASCRCCGPPCLGHGPYLLALISSLGQAARAGVSPSTRTWRL